jgi:hypothetical protein
MAQITKLRCPKCDLHTETNDVVPAGKSIACPRCRVLMEITRPAGAVEDDRAPNFTDDLEPILSTRANRMKMAQKRDLISNRPPPFHHSRSFIAAVSVTAIALGVCVLAILYRNVIGQLNRGMKDIRTNRENRVINNLQPKPAKPKTELAKSTNGATAGAVAGTADRAAGAKQNPGPKEYQGPVDAPAETKIGDLVVNVSDAFLVKVYPGSLAQCLLLKIRVKNLSKNPITFVSWSQSENHVELVDSEGKHLRRLDPLVPDPRVIEPDQSFEDKVAFEQAPLGFDLDLELGIAGRQRPIQIHIPGSLIKRSMDAAFVPALGQQQSGMGAPTQGAGLGMGNGLREPAKEESPFSVEVNAAYNDAVARANRRLSGMGSNERINFMRRKKAETVESLAKKHGVTKDKIRQVLVDP